jgi:hypothetical protein
MTEHKPLLGRSCAEAPRAGVDATPSRIEVRRKETENKCADEAIRLLSAEIMDAYGLCRPLEGDRRLAKTL